MSLFSDDSNPFDTWYSMSSIHWGGAFNFVSTVPPVFDSMCTDNGISFMRDHQQYDYLWDIAIGSYTLTPQLASERGYILTNDSTTLILAVPLFTIGYIYEVKLDQAGPSCRICFKILNCPMSCDRVAEILTWSLLVIGCYSEAVLWHFWTSHQKC